MSVKYCDIVNLRLVECAGVHNPILGFIPKGMGQNGYGKKISTEYEVQLRGEGERWYKVYASCFSNVACLYTSKGYCHDWELEEHRDRARKAVKQSLEEYFATLHEMKPAPFNPSYNPEYVKRCEELEAELKRFRDQEPEPPRCERIRKQAELYSEIYGADYPSRMAKRYPECFPEGGAK